ncbi:MAG: M20/M25/M40 family metallo-hydrolase, partial [Chloroflexi bacterium]
IQLLLALPHGVAGMSASIAGFVETSNNLAIIATEGQQIKIVSSQRSSVMSRLEELTSRIEAVGTLAGANVNSDEAYPAWQPDMASPLLGKGKAIYQQMFGVAPRVEMIHAGLECGIIGKKYPGMDMISIGATLQHPHSPNERLNIPSVAKVWDFLVELLKNIQA